MKVFKIVISNVSKNDKEARAMAPGALEKF